ncbi:hypothetical protein ColLi_07226 [Colletotrichum liriopes]|uniref:Uncharacterized protein n=1 Tax=Colletotrichum liriopes TaxID=708192 RepID=A0AA37LUE6_9PEZI|nr:hypothetical protein ColLi_07226 [Colletotrichum liriopes]
MELLSLKDEKLDDGDVEKVVESMQMRLAIIKEMIRLILKGLIGPLKVTEVWILTIDKAREMIG